MIISIYHHYHNKVTYDFVKELVNEWVVYNLQLSPELSSEENQQITEGTKQYKCSVNKINNLHIITPRTPGGDTHILSMGPIFHEKIL